MILADNPRVELFYAYDTDRSRGLGDVYKRQLLIV